VAGDRHPFSAPPDDLPRHRRGIAAQGRSRYPDYDVLEQARHWDDATRRVVLARVEDPPPLRFFSAEEARFFSAEEARTLRAFCDVVTAQDEDPRVPVLEMVDAKLHAGRLDGFRHADLPDDREVWRLAARGLDECVRAGGVPHFASAPPELRIAIVADFHTGDLRDGVWADLPAAKVFGVLMRAVLAEFYSHPWAWNEIGFGGPAYPRGYARMGIGTRESWEGEEQFDVDPVRDVAERGVDR
jgi:hypothetical protein